MSDSYTNAGAGQDKQHLCPHCQYEQSTHVGYDILCTHTDEEGIAGLRRKGVGTPSLTHVDDGGYVAVPTQDLANVSDSDTEIFSRKNEGLGNE